MRDSSSGEQTGRESHGENDCRDGAECPWIGGRDAASEAKNIEFAHQGGWIVVTLDADFRVLLAFSGATGPSVVRIRIEGQRAEELAALLVSVLKVCKDDLVQGAMISSRRKRKWKSSPLILRRRLMASYPPKPFPGTRAQFARALTSLWTYPDIPFR